MRTKTWSEEVIKRHKSKSVIGMPVKIDGRTCIIRKIHKDSVEVIECNRNPHRYKRYK